MASKNPTMSGLIELERTRYVKRWRHAPNVCHLSEEYYEQLERENPDKLDYSDVIANNGKAKFDGMTLLTSDRKLHIGFSADTASLGDFYKKETR